MKDFLSTIIKIGFKQTPYHKYIYKYGYWTIYINRSDIKWDLRYREIQHDCNSFSDFTLLYKYFRSELRNHQLKELGI